MDSDFIGELSYAIDVPLNVANYKHLQYIVPADRFCGYTPTLLDLLSSSQTIGSSEIAPVVDLLDPIVTYPEGHPTDLLPKDAALLVGLIPEVSLTSTVSKPCFGRTGNPAEKPENLDKVSAVDTILSHFGFNRTRSFVHPENASLKPINVLPVLPHHFLEKNKYRQIGLPEPPAMHPESSSKPRFILQAVEKGGAQRRRQFSLYTRRPEEGPESEKCDAVEGRYGYTCDLLAEFCKTGTQHVNLMLDLPRNVDLGCRQYSCLGQPFKNDAPQDPSNCAYIMPIQGAKTQFTKCRNTRRARSELTLVSIPPSARHEEEQTDKTHGKDTRSDKENNTQEEL